MAFKPGQIVNIPCKVQPGAFPHERLIVIDIEGAPISGFAKVVDLVLTDKDTGYIHGQIIKVEANQVTVEIPASFFTLAAGRTSVPSTWAQSHLTAAAV